MANQIDLIDINRVFKNKNPKLYKILPGFIFRYIKKIVHQDEINDFLKKHGDKTGLEFVKSAIDEFNVSIHIKGIENLPKEGRFIFASNHPLGGFDGLMLIYIISQHFQSVRFLVNDILMNLKNFEPFFVPINKHGSQSKDSVKRIDEIYSSNKQILYFPAGLVSRKINGIIKDLEWKKNFINKAIKHKRDIIPVYISGRNTNRFYNLANWRKLLKIKWNLEMFFLPDETFKHKGKSFTVNFGKPISYKIFDKSKTIYEWAKEVRKKAYALSS
ncbi:MAG: glycerol acyltransferase [Chlorobi bacterium]|nr:glycerol acyltransferase [Chlorobiota bacterium]